MKKLIGILLMGGFVVVLIAAVINLVNPATEVRGKAAAVQISGQLTPEQETAQKLARADGRVQSLTVGHRSELFGVRNVMAGQYTEAAAACAAADCRQVEIYNWDEDAAVVALVNLETNTVLDVLHQPGIRPGINKRLHDLSLDIATNAPEVIAALGYKPTGAKVLAAVDAGLLDSPCAGEHLCVAPTFATDDGRVLWAFIDLTDEIFISIDWTEAPPTGSSEPFVPTGGCPSPGSVTRDGWTMDYAVTGTDSMNITNVAYDGVTVATGIKLLEWHADYGSSGYQDSTGCGGGGGGFPIYPYGPTQVLDLLDDQNNVIGFEVVQDFRMGNWGNSCNYRYEQRIRFYPDGSFQPLSTSYGKGCGTNALYRPVVRINMAINGDANDQFGRWDGLAWQMMATEDYLVPYAEIGHGPHQIDANGYSWVVEDTITGNGYYIVQDVGQFENGQGDNPFVYATLHHANEGDTDLGAFSSGCCNDNHQQGPHLFLNGESVADANLVLWYVPQAPTDAVGPDYYCWTVAGEPNPETYPCYMGPLFVPMSQAPEAGFSHNGPVVLGDMAVFTNTTSGADPITYTWNFGDASPLSDLENPTHDYAAVGDYTVTLTATNETGTDVVSHTLQVGMAPTAVFTHPVSAPAYQPITFTNLSEGTPPLSFAWEFGDETSSNEENPSHVYTESGQYVVALTTTSPFGSDTYTSSITIDETNVAPTAVFTHSLPVFVGLPVQFTNESYGTSPITYTWDFGDSSPITTTVSPSHTYLLTGTFTITLTATNEYGSSTAVRVINVVLLDNFVYLPVAIKEEIVPEN